MSLPNSHIEEAQAGVNIPGDDMVPEPVRIAFPPIPESYEVVPELGAWSDPPTVNPIARARRRNPPQPRRLPLRPPVLLGSG
ncbi:hypothetical protein A1Q2_00705 [Trichosporon asahii var. asahii CBS 8904]|uniref:Uncharacterized protein n=1 Tax=Trichosporon asahii var. asahii (strain CBS 8904) TaxID=1220162 RepID=K1VWW0_TRIAC|nr:hypothetical protein A1Q2_00705 [Trichosporon asahii var. asahii CBS 8904]